MLGMKKDSSAGGFELLGVSAENTKEQNSDLESHKAATETKTSGGTNSQHQHSNSKASDSPLQVKSEDEATLNAGDAEPDSNIVWWDGEDDPENPYNWPAWQKYLNCGLISALTFITPLASSIFAPGVPKLMVEFEETNQELAAFVVSVYVLGFAFGPMLMAPLSEVYGRTIVYHICNILFLCFTVGCALAPNMAALIVFRFLAGSFGACPMTNGGGSISDMIAQEKRAVAMSAFSIGPLIGPILGPVVGGVLVDNEGWRWVFWVVTIIGGFLAATMILTMRETYAPIILKRKTQRLIKETGNLNLRSKLDTGLSDADLFKRAIVRPTKLLIFSPICTIFAFYLMIVYGYLYLLFTSVPFIFQGAYGFSASTVGLVYLGLGVGSFVGLFWFSIDSNKQLQKMKALQQDHKDVKPEVRLKLLPVGTLLLPVGFFIYGWTTEYETHWMAPIVGLAVIGTGNLMCFMAVSMYLVDAYNLYAASALAANTVMRSIAGATLPLCALKMYDALGLGWGNSLLAFIAIALLPIPLLIGRYGEKLRTSFNNDRL
ncbi:MFS domain-containing protein [Fusarium keratoplasticum]|uniref:MFS domain-containing protein n=1 Tax=Fusarium keratoplasticum TaxID=1328300 RepID=A0ACC0RE26_9HYPO|nr:MFS domain-containing protein [Fusarium keratoplasticum]KAI8683389.1 MFS domain-containing protein [Fusarium keratoplasticum]